MTSKLLINEPPLTVLPSLAVAVGLNESIFVQQLHYWIAGEKSGREVDGRRWIYNSASAWQKQFPFWSEVTIKRIITSLRDKKLIESRSDLNAMAVDRTNWYTINYETLRSFESINLIQSSDQGDDGEINLIPPSDQSDTIKGSKRSDHYQRLTTETTAETTSNSSPYNPPRRFVENNPKTDATNGRGVTAHPTIAAEEERVTPLPPASAAQAISPQRPMIAEKPPTAIKAFFDAYPEHRRCSMEECVRLWREVPEDTRPRPSALLEKLKAQVESDDWTKEGGKYVPGMAKYIREGWWQRAAGPSSNPWMRNGFVYPIYVKATKGLTWPPGFKPNEGDIRRSKVLDEDGNWINNPTLY
jgi:hypothetical protein